MKKLMMTLAAATMGGMVFADVSVVDVKCTPRTPWNGLVDVEYTIACDDPDADVYVNPVAYDGDRRLTMFPSAFTGDGATNTVKAGKHTMVWDAMKDFGAFSSANFQLKMYAGKRLARYVVVDLSSGADSDNYPIRLSHVGPDLSNDTCRTTELWLRLVPPGEFWMGSPADEIGRAETEDYHHVTLTKPFYIGVFEVTRQQWLQVQGDGHGDRGEFREAANSAIRPVDCVHYGRSDEYSIRGSNWPLNTTGLANDCFVVKLRSRAGNGSFDLPSETRWEYACRAGLMTALYNGKNLSNTTTSGALSEIAGYYGNRYNDMAYDGTSVAVGTAPVGSFKPNALGLYDMLGNVWEICLDGYAPNAPIADKHIGTEDLLDPLPSGGDWEHIVRGGCWKSVARECRAANREKVLSWSNYENAVGFRVCAEAEF